MMARKPKQGTLKPNVNPNDEAECIALIEDFDSQIARIKQKMQTTYARYEKMGVDVDGVKYAVKMRKKDDAAAIHQRRTAALMRAGIIPTSQDGDGQGDFSGALHIDMPSPELRQKLALGRVRADGYNSGLAGGLITACKYNPGSEEFVTWRDGWDLGHADRLEKNPDADKVTQAAPRKRGRKARNGAGAGDGIGATAGNA